jgi:hypothetical protein
MKTIAHGVIAAGLLVSAGAALGDPMPICPDRPGRGTGTCTVPKGMVQIETGLVDWTHDEAADFTADATTIGSTLIKYGVSDRADIELGVTPLIRLRATGTRTESGFGDTLLRVKYALTPNGAPVTVALDPFVKLPTANRIFGNGKVEAGLAVPVSAALGKSPLTLSLTPEVDWLADGDGNGHHAAMVQVVGLGLAATSLLTLGAELWGQRDWDPAGSGRQASADASAAYLVNGNVAIDGGANFGLNDQTPDTEVYAGVSVRF